MRGDTWTGRYLAYFVQPGISWTHPGSLVRIALFPFFHRRADHFLNRIELIMDPLRGQILLNNSRKFGCSTMPAVAVQHHYSEWRVRHRGLEASLFGLRVLALVLVGLGFSG